MVFNFLYPDDDEDFSKRNELESIIKAEVKNHFEEKDYYKYYENYASYYGGSIHIEIFNEAYFDDIEKAKKRMADMENKYMTDFISDIQENLSFVPKIIVG